MLMDVKKEYSSLRKKYKLPKLSDLDYAFEIRSIMCDSCILLREIRKRAVEKIDTYVDYLQPLIQPDNEFIALHEYKAFSDVDRDRILALFRKLMGLDRLSLITETDNSDKANAKFIQSAYESWSEVQKEMAFVALKLQNSWGKEVNIKQNLEYLG